ncbi:MAG: hypothetical protein HYS12_26405 [Planctomycetes bacterium]|nr:hypothetical protein [Planctomycetota bacterium]
MRWQTLAGVALLAAVPAQAKDYTLAEASKPGDCFRIQLTMKLAGQMRFQRDGKMVPVELSAAAAHEFSERALALGKSGTIEKVARFYEKAGATITVGKDRTQRALRPERRLVVAQRCKEVPLLYCPVGPLFRQELELTSEHFDTLHLSGLLPGKAVRIGTTWKVSNAVAQALCNFEGLAEHDLTCKLEQVDKTARVSVKGTATGIDVGAQVKMTVDAVYHFDLSAARLVWMEWKQKDEREQGPASPATTVETTTTLTREPVAQPPSLTDMALISVPQGEEVPPQMLQLDYQDDKGRFNLLYGRDWHLVSRSDEHVVMRLMDRGDFVAQVTISPWTPAPKGKPHLSAEEFKQAVNDTPGWQPEGEVQAGEVPSEKGRWVYRLSESGRLDGLEVVQNFYLVAHEDGRQVVFAFTMTPKQAERIGTRDLSLVGSLDFPPAKK